MQIFFDPQPIDAHKKSRQDHLNGFIPYYQSFARRFDFLSPLVALP